MHAAVLSVPSAVIRPERNYIMNLAHPDFNRLTFGEPKTFRWDERLKTITRKSRRSHPQGDVHPTSCLSPVHAACNN